MLVKLKELLEHSEKHKYGIGAFNTTNLEITLGIVRAAVEKQAPVIIQVSETTIKYAGLKPITHIVQTIAKNEAVNVPVALHLDHGKTFRSVAECINAGFSSIMIDASDLPYDENVILTRTSVQYAHKRGVLAQGELGRISGSEDTVKVSAKKASMTSPSQAHDFVNETKVDVLAVSVGNVHGITKMKTEVPKLDLKRLQDIDYKVKVPLVLHGASGIPEKQIREAIKHSVRIINIDTEIRMAFTDSLKKTLKDKPKSYDPRKVLSPSMDAVQRVAAQKVEMFGSAGMAKAFQ